MSTPFKMNMPNYGQGKNPIQMSDSPEKKKVTNEDGSTTRTRKNIFTGRTKTVTKTKGDDYTKAKKNIVVKDRKGTVRKEKDIYDGEKNRAVGGVKDKGSAPDTKVTRKYDKSGKKKSDKTVTTKGIYDTREQKYKDGTGVTSKELETIGGLHHQKREVTKYKKGKKVKDTGEKRWIKKGKPESVKLLKTDKKGRRHTK
jgi:hypothetical protein